MPIHVATATASPRPNSEDRLAVHHVEGGVVAVVADGAGGMGGGGGAADVALEIIADAIEHGTFNRFSPDPWAELLVHADAIIASERNAGETTIVIVAISGEGRLVGASCGDSSAVIVASDGRIDDLTAGQKRKRLGSGRAMPIAFARPCLDGVLVVATDGLFSYVPPASLAKVLEQQDLDTATSALVRAVRLPSGALQDDVAILTVRHQGA